MTEAKAAGGTAVPGDLKQAVAGFVSELKTFREDIQKKLEAQEDRMTMLDRKTAFRGRTPLSTQTEVAQPHQKAFADYLRKGDDGALRHMGIEEKGMTVAGDGGFLVTPQVADRVENTLRAGNSLRRVANVVAVEGTSYEMLVDSGDLSTGWVDESAVAESTGQNFTRVSIKVHELSAMPKASQRLLDDAAFDLEGWLAERIADRFARAEAAAFVDGDGQDKPEGFLNHMTAPDALDVDNAIGFVTTGVAGDFDASNPADALVDLVYALGAHYRANACFVMNSKTAGAVRKMKDVDGRFLWTDSLAAAEPARLMGYPVIILEDMPDIEDGANAIAFGDFHSGYTIVERPDLRVLRDPFSAKPHVLFYATKRVGGGVTDPKAIKILKFTV